MRNIEGDSFDKGDSYYDAKLSVQEDYQVIQNMRNNYSHLPLRSPIYQVGLVHTAIGAMYAHFNVYPQSGGSTNPDKIPDLNYWEGFSRLVETYLGDMATGPGRMVTWIRCFDEKGDVMWVENGVWTMPRKLNKITDRQEVDPASGDYEPPWVFGGSLGLKVPETFDSRSQEIIIGFATNEAPIQKHSALVDEKRVIIAFPGNMFGLPIDTWVIQELQSNLESIKQSFLDESYPSWDLLAEQVQETYKSMEEEKLELSLNREGGAFIYRKTDEPIGEGGRYVDSKMPQVVANDGLWHEQTAIDDAIGGMKNLKHWRTFIVPTPYLSSEGTLIDGDSSIPITQAEFKSGNVIMSIGRIANRWLGTRTINWAVPYPLIPWTDPLE